MDWQKALWGVLLVTVGCAQAPHQLRTLETAQSRCTPFLFPETGIYAPGLEPYQLALGERLFSTPEQRQVQMLVAPPLEKEEAVFLVQDVNVARVVYRRMPRNLWTAMMREIRNSAQDKSRYALGPREQSRALANVADVPETWQAPLPLSVAERLSSLWTRALNGVRQSPHPADGVARDGVHYHFAALVGGRDIYAGRAYSPPPGSTAARLVDVGQALARYARAGDKDEEAHGELLRSLTDLSSALDTCP
jgi:hypothetical protein